MVILFVQIGIFVTFPTKLSTMFKQFVTETNYYNFFIKMATENSSENETGAGQESNVAVESEPVLAASDVGTNQVSQENAPVTDIAT